MLIGIAHTGAGDRTAVWRSVDIGIRCGRIRNIYGLRKVLSIVDGCI